MARSAMYAAVLCVLLLSLGRPADAEPVLIRAGGIDFDTTEPPGLYLAGDAFYLVISPPNLRPSFPPACVPPEGCAPGTSVSLSLMLGGPTRGFDLASGFAVVGENSYGAIDGPRVIFRGQLSFDAATLPIPDGDRVTLRSPFVLTGSVAAFQDATSTVPLFQADVTGSGIASRVLQRNPLGGYEFRDFDYRIQDPVPEPATLLLFGSGVAGLAIRRYRRARR